MDDLSKLTGMGSLHATSKRRRTDTMNDLSKLTGMGSLHATSKRRRTDTINDLSKLTGMGSLHATSKRRRTKKHMILGLGQPGQRKKNARSEEILKVDSSRSLAVEL